MGVLMYLILSLLVYLKFLVAHFFCHPKKMAKSYWSYLLRWLIKTKPNWHTTHVAYSFHEQLIMINTRQLFNIMILSIILHTSRMNILCWVSNALCHMRYHLFHIISYIYYCIISYYHMLSSFWQEQFYARGEMKTFLVDIKASKEANFFDGTR